MGNRKAELTKEMNGKIEELETALGAVQAKAEELDTLKAKGAETVAGAEVKKAELTEALNLATDLGEAKLLMQQIEELGKDIELTGFLRNGQTVKATEELAELLTSFFAVHAEARNAFREMDSEYVKNMSISTVEEDTATMRDVAKKINSAFHIATSLLYEAGIAQQGAVRYGNTHLGQMELISKGGSLASELRIVQRKLSII